jgi:hypothetical protein
MDKQIPNKENNLRNILLTLINVLIKINLPKKGGIKTMITTTPSRGPYSLLVQPVTPLQTHEADEVTALLADNTTSVPASSAFAALGAIAASSAALSASSFNAAATPAAALGALAAAPAVALGAASASSAHTAAATVITSASSSNKVKSQASQIKNPTDLKNALDNAPLNRHNYVILNQIAKKWLQAKRSCFVRSNLNSWSITVKIEVNPKLQAALQTHFTKGKFKSQTPADNNTRKRNLALATQLVDKRIIAMANRTLRIPIDGGKKISITYYFKRD